MLFGVCIRGNSVAAALAALIVVVAVNLAIVAAAVKVLLDYLFVATGLQARPGWAEALAAAVLILTLSPKRGCGE